MKRIDLEHVSVRFGEVQALSDVSTSISSGEVVMLAGPNGAGKSTLLKVVLGLLEVDDCVMRVDGEHTRPDRSFKKHLGYLPESVAFAESLTGQQVLRFFARARGVAPEQITTVLRRVGLTSAGHRAIRGYSHGMRQRLGLAIAILGDPALLILDEPTGGLDQEGLAVLWGVLAEWRAKGRFVLLSSHDLTLLERRVDRICLLCDGRLLVDASPSELRERAALPVRVSFDVGGNTTAFADALAVAGYVEQRDPQNGGISVMVPPHGLLGVLDVRSQFNGTVRQVRVEEPGLDAVYECLLNRGTTSGNGGRVL